MAGQLGNVPDRRAFYHGRSTIRRALTAIRLQIRGNSQQSLIEDIREAFPVAEGEGSLLRWSDVRRGLARNPERHFQDLVELAELADEAATPHVGRREITNVLVSLGQNSNTSVPPTAPGSA